MKVMENLKEQIEEKHILINRIKTEVGKVLVGQSKLVEGLLIGLFTKGHILVEGVPGLAKTSAINAIANTSNVKFKRIQFTPDLLPADLIGTEIFLPEKSKFSIRKGPIFNNIILADEINRAPSKVQSALLEAMQEKQVTIGDETFKLEEPFLVLATQNPIEQEGTYPLPEAQVDRFMLKILIDYPSKEEEKEIMKKIAFETPQKVEPIITPKDFDEIFSTIQNIYIDEKLKDYIINIIFATREPKKLNLDIAKYIQFGASPRATIYLTLASRAYAFLKGRTYVSPQDIKNIAFSVLRHRIILSYEAEAEDIVSDDIIKNIFDSIEVP